jgi:competence protein ComEC
MYFHLFSPVSTPANIVAVPLGTLALMSNLGALVCGTWLPWATELFNHAAWFFMVAMTDVSEWATKIPGAFFYVPAPSWVEIGIYYAVIIGALSGWLFTPKRKIWSAVILILIVATYFWRWEQSRDETDLTVLPLNGGHAVFVDAAGQKNDWLVNCGDENAIQFTLKNFLRARGVNKIPRLILTEGDLKNVGGAQLLDELSGVGEVWTSPVHFRSSAYNEIVATFEKPPSRRKTLNRGDFIGCWRVQYPAATNNFPRADDNALVLFGNFTGAKILLLSDLSRAGQDALLSRTNDLRADIVIAGLPDNSEPLCNALIDAIQPKVIVIADSEFPATRRASHTLRERLEQRKIPVIYTRTSGAVTIVTDKSGWKLRTMDGQIFSSFKA